MYELSRYNFTVNDEVKPRFLLYNSLSGSILRLSDTAQKKYKDLQMGICDINESDPITTVFTKHGIIVPHQYNTDEYIDYLRAEYVERNDTLELTILITEACNLRCKYCYERFENGDMPENIEQGIIKYIQDNISKYRRCLIKWFGGEPLLNIDAITRLMPQIINICNNHGVQLRSSITTNGMLLTPDVVRVLLKLKIYEYQVTIDGLAETHDAQRVTISGDGTFETIISNLISIRDNVTNRLLSILIRTNFTKTSITEIDSFGEFISKEFGNDSRFSIFWTSAMDWGGESVKSMSSKLLPVFNRALVNKYAVKHNLPLIIERSFLFPSKKVCYASKHSSFVIGATGKIFKCSQRIYDDYNTIGQVLPTGQFIIDKVKESLWISASVRYFDKCKKCILNPCCLSGRCPKRYIANDDCDFDEQQLRDILINIDEEDLRVINV